MRGVHRDVTPQIQPRFSSTLLCGQASGKRVTKGQAHALPRAGRRETVFRPKDRAGQHGEACCKSYHFWLGYTPHALAPAGQPLAGSRPFGGGFAVNLAVFAAKV